MDIKYTNEIISAMHDFLNENGFAIEEASFKKDSRVFSVEYNEPKKEFVLSAADISEDGEKGVSAVLSTWFFDEADHGANDIACIANDFTELVAASIGVELKTASINSIEVAMPEKNLAGTEPGIEAFTQKFLAMFPQYKDAYKEMIAKYGDFLSIIYTYPKNAEPASLKLVFFYMGYGVYTLTPFCREGYLCVRVNTHDILNRQSEEYYKELDKGRLNDYGFDTEENKSPETTYWKKIFVAPFLTLL